MKFWMTIAAGVVVVTGLATALYVGNPDLAKKREVDANVAALNTGPQPTIQYDTDVERKENVAQNQKGESIFEIRNAGEADLTISPERPNCVCAYVILSRSNGEKVKLEAGENARWQYEDNKSVLTIPPKESAKLQIGWDSKTRSGLFQVLVTLTTNDPKKKQPQFRVDLDIKQDFTMNPESFIFGSFGEGAKAERSVDIFSMVEKDLKLSDPKINNKNLTVRIDPLSAEEMTKYKAVSGQKVTLTVTGQLPVGILIEKLILKTSSVRVPEVSLDVSGTVTGKISVAPAIVDFGLVSNKTATEKKVEIVAKGQSKKLKIADFDPPIPHLQAALTQDADFPSIWKLTITVKPSTSLGLMKSVLHIDDEAGARKINVPIRGNLVNALLQAAKPDVSGVPNTRPNE